MIVSKTNSLSKRCLEDNSTPNSVNNLNKRVKSDVKCETISPNDIKEVTNGFNGLTTNSNTMSVGCDAIDDFTDAFNDGLEELMSQVAAIVPNRLISHLTTQSIPQPQRPQSMDIRDQNMCSNGDSYATTDAREGRLKILESKNKTLTEELNKYKKQSIYFQNQIQTLKDDYKQRADESQKTLETEIRFLKNESKSSNETIKSLQHQISKAKGIPLQFIPEFGNHLVKHRNTLEGFSQIKHQEFYAPLPNTQSSIVGTSGGSSAVLVPESQPQPSTGSGIIRYNNNTNNFSSFPSQIPSTQTLLSMTQPLTQPMDRNCNHPKEIVKNSQITSQSSTQMTQTSRYERIKCGLETAVAESRVKLSQCFIDQNISLYNNQWIEDTQQINDYVFDMKTLIHQLGAKCLF